MSFFSKIKNLFRSKKYDVYSKNFCLEFDGLDSFVEYISENHDFDSNYLYYYQGEAKTLVKLISSEYSSGEKDIPYLSLEHVGGCTSKNNNIFFEDAIFIPDVAFDIANKYYFLDLGKPHHCMYRSYTSGFHHIYKFVIARENVYLCSK